MDTTGPTTKTSIAGETIAPRVGAVAIATRECAVWVTSLEVV